MKVSEAIAARRSVRAFKDIPVSRGVIEPLLERAKWAPSGGNLQPWKVYVLGDTSMDNGVPTSRHR